MLCLVMKTNASSNQFSPNALGPRNWAARGRGCYDPAIALQSARPSNQEKREKEKDPRQIYKESISQTRT